MNTLPPKESPFTRPSPNPLLVELIVAASEVTTSEFLVRKRIAIAPLLVPPSSDPGLQAPTTRSKMPSPLISPVMSRSLLKRSPPSKEPVKPPEPSSILIKLSGT